MPSQFCVPTQHSPAKTCLWVRESPPRQWVDIWPISLILASYLLHLHLRLGRSACQWWRSRPAEKRHYSPWEAEVLLHERYKSRGCGNFESSPVSSSFFGMYKAN